MSAEPPSTDSELRALIPTALDDDFLDRLEACATGNLASLTQEEMQFEKMLRRFSASALDPKFLSELQTTVAGIPFPRDHKVVLFPKSGVAPRTSRSWKPTWAAAAAVALIGATTALMFPGGEKTSPVARISPSVTMTPPNGNIVPASYGPSEARDEGVVWKANDRPHRIYKMTYNDVVSRTNADGKTEQVIRPRVEYILVPEKGD